MGFCSTLLSQSGAARTRRRSWWSRARLVQAGAGFTLGRGPRGVPHQGHPEAGRVPRRRPGQAPLSPAPPASPSDLIRSASATGSHGSRLCRGRRRPPRGPERGRRTRPPWARRGHPHTGRAVVDLERRVSGGLPAPALRCARTAGERGGQPTSESVRSGWRERDTEGLHGAEVLLRRPRGGWLVAMHVFDEMTHRREQGKDGW